MDVIADMGYIYNVNNEMLLTIIYQNEKFGKVFNINDGLISEVCTQYKNIRRK